MLKSITTKQEVTIRKLAAQRNYKTEDLCFNATGGRTTILRHLSRNEASRIIVYLLKEQIAIIKEKS